MVFKMSKISSNIMDLTIPSNYIGRERIPGVAAVHTKLPIVGVNVKIIRRYKGTTATVGTVEIGPYLRGTTFSKHHIDDVMHWMVYDNFMNEKPRLKSEARSLIERYLDINTIKAIPSAVMAPNRRSTAINDNLLGHVHAILSFRDGHSYIVEGKQQGVVWENDYTKKTGGPDKYCVVLLKTYAKRLVTHKMEGVGPDAFKCKKKPNDLIENHGIKPFCWFEKTYY